jgi:hypothetical protein
MAEIVNLRLARKRAARDAREKEAAQNRVHFGLSKTERQQGRVEAERDGKRLDQHRLGPVDAKDG